MHFFIVSIRRIILQISFISLSTLHLLYTHVYTCIHLHYYIHLSCTYTFRFNCNLETKESENKDLIKKQSNWTLQIVLLHIGFQKWIESRHNIWSHNYPFCNEHFMMKIRFIKIKRVSRYFQTLIHVSLLSCVKHPDILSIRKCIARSFSIFHFNMLSFFFR